MEWFSVWSLLRQGDAGGVKSQRLQAAKPRVSKCKAKVARSIAGGGA